VLHISRFARTLITYLSLGPEAINEFGKITHLRALHRMVRTDQDYKFENFALLEKLHIVSENSIPCLKLSLKLIQFILYFSRKNPGPRALFASLNVMGCPSLNYM
jgi:hypothetical protein